MTRAADKPRGWRLWGRGLRGLRAHMRETRNLYEWWPLRLRLKPWRGYFAWWRNSIFNWHGVQSGWAGIGVRVMSQVYHVGPLVVILGRRSLLALALLLTLPLAAQPLTPGTGLVASAGDQIKLAGGQGTPAPGCSTRYALGVSHDPWAMCGIDPYVDYASTSQCFVAAYSVRYGRPECRVLGPSGADPHGNLASRMLQELCRDGAGGSRVTGKPSTHNCRPTERELADASWSLTVWNRIEDAYEAAYGPPPDCTGHGWGPGPVTADLLEDSGCRALSEFELRVSPEGVGDTACCWRRYDPGFGLPAQCRWAATLPCLSAEPPPPPPPEPTCGDGTCDPSEDCDTCEVDCGPCPVEPPVEPEGCDVALDALVEAAGAVEMECRQ